MPHFGSWVTFAERDGLDRLVGMIATGRTADTVAADPEIREFLSALPAGSRVLDFGCGVCRNAADFAIAFPHLSVVGYDSPQMLGRAAEFVRHRHGVDLAGVGNLTLSGDWTKLASERFDLVYATLVLQHIEPGDIRSYLADIKAMAPRLLVHGRRKNDHSSESTWRIIESCGLVPANAAAIGYSPDGPDEEHLPICVYEIA